MTSESRAWERPDGTGEDPRVEMLAEGLIAAWPILSEESKAKLRPKLVTLLASLDAATPAPEATDGAPLRRSRTEVRADAFREAADLVDVLTTGWRNAACRDSAHATAEVSKLLRGLARLEEAKDV